MTAPHEYNDVPTQEGKINTEAFEPRKAGLSSVGQKNIIKAHHPADLL